MYISNLEKFLKQFILLTDDFVSVDYNTKFSGYSTNK